MDYTTDELVSTLVLRTQVAQAAQKFTTADYISMLNYELQDNIVDEINKLNEDYLIDDLWFQTVVGQNYYPMPPRTRQPRLRDLRLVNPQVTNNTPNYSGVPRITLENVAGDNSTYTYYNNQSHFYEGNYLKLFPTPSVVQTYSMLYFRQPNDLCSTSEAGQVTSINTGTNTIIASVPNSWTTANTIDAVNPTPIGGCFELDAQNVSIVSISTPTIVLSSVSGIKVDDWISLAGTSPIPCVPMVCRNALIQATVLRVLEGIGDSDRIGTSAQIYTRNIEAMKTALAPRTEGELLHVSSNGDSIYDNMRFRNNFQF